ncbi:hypothetical protein QZN08_15870 [Burkholderia multivorans]|nr:hypothetical protein [Burkholderia multivorans]MDN8015919.1 hypothetical protein [Burkholderia multivorans]MDN8055792.1 hypothetical protein [Burkholderia multivorans]
MTARLFDVRGTALRDSRHAARVQRGIDLQRARHEIELVDVARIEPRAVDRDAAVLGAELSDRTLLVEFDGTGDERHVIRVDEAAAVHADSVRVRDDHTRGLPGDFRRAGQHRRVAARHLVEDH